MCRVHDVPARFDRPAATSNSQEHRCASTMCRKRRQLMRASAGRRVYQLSLAMPWRMVQATISKPSQPLRALRKVSVSRFSDLVLRKGSDIVALALHRL